ncbi:DUF424 family protein [Candidatus Woesearchaeota archaeon]|nr:DUF424 family protein [Candidatus Woesearchaeota archaeon]
MIVKKHKTRDGRLILAVCDEELVGKIFDEGEKHLDLSSNFYKGEKRTEEEVKNLLKMTHIINVAGKNSINFILKKGIISKEEVDYTKKIPHTQVIILRDD